MKKKIITLSCRLVLLLLGSTMTAQLAPENHQKLLFVGQDLQSVEDYRNNCKGCHPGHGETTYLAFYILKVPFIGTPDGGIFFGGMGMDDEGNFVENNTNWGAGPLNLWKAASRSPLVNVGLNITTQFAPQGLEKIARGEHDDIIEKMALLFNKFPETVFYLRIGYEFDGTWNIGYSNTNNYIGAFRRIVDMLRFNLEQDNVKFVWQGSASPVDDIIEQGERENIENWYPGDSYVDWTGISWFLGVNEQPVPSLNTFDKIPTQLQLAREMLTFSEQHNKPMLIGEATPQGYQFDKLDNCNMSPVWDGEAAQDCQTVSARKIYKEWFAPLFQFVNFNNEIQGLSYINADWDVQTNWGPPYNAGYWGDTRIEENDFIRLKWISEFKTNNFLKTTDTYDVLEAIGYEIPVGKTNPTRAVTDTFTKQKSAPLVILPNPGGNQLTIQGAAKDDPLLIVDMNGKQVIKGTGNTTDISKLSKGMYLVKSGVGKDAMPLLKK